MVLTLAFLKKKGLALDKYQGLFLFTRIWNLFGYLITFFFVATYLSQIDQGYYYTLNSLIALQVFFELGFSYVIVQKSSHLYSLWASKEKHTDECKEFADIASFFYYIIQWFSASSVLLVCVLLTLGELFFKKNPEATGESLHIMWFLLVVLTSLNLILTAILSFFEGYGKAMLIYKIKLFQNISSQFILWTSIFWGFGIYSIVFSNLTLLMVGLAIVMAVLRRDIFTLLKKRVNRFRYWFKNLFRYQSKVALSWISGYLQFQLLVPVIFHYLGAVDAGKMGNTFSIVSGITALSLAVIQSKSWEYSALVAVKDFVKLNKLFKKHLMQSLIISLIVGIGVYSSVLVLNQFKFSLSQKILPPLPFLGFVIATIFNVVVASLAIYLRAFLEEKLLIVSVLCGVSIISLLFFLTPYYGLMGVSAVYLGCTFVFGFLGSLYIYNKKIQTL